MVRLLPHSPYQWFTTADGDDITTTFLLLAVGVAVSHLTAHARTLKLVTVTAHLMRIHETASPVQSGGSSYAAVDHVREQLVETPARPPLRTRHAARSAPPPGTGGLGDRRPDHLGPGRGRLARPGVELRASVGGRCPGRFMLRSEPSAVPPPLQTRLVAVSLADQVSAALDTAGPALDG
ncbi:hypothetical protein AB0F77_38775 [Streptomyces sp. NPDC026672]|uniref:hypothetical protein n=1 Tax=unclassified Streptomyces TaxID=2593676 RepID=UPI003400C2B8